MTAVVTIADRKAREAARRAAAVDEIAAALADHARARGGRFLLFGSAARGTMRHDSDLDVVVDFAPALESEAWRLVEDLCREHRIPADVKAASTTHPDFLARIADTARVVA